MKPSRILRLSVALFCILSAVPVLAVDISGNPDPAAIPAVKTKSVLPVAIGAPPPLQDQQSRSSSIPPIASNPSISPQIPSGFRSFRITEDVVWKGEVVVDGAVTVAPQATLTIEPGTQVKIAPAGGPGGIIVVHGRLVADGSPEMPVLFSPQTVEGKPGTWQGIFFIGSEKKNILEHCRISGATFGIDGAFSTLSLRNTAVSGGGIRCTDCLLSVSGGSIHQSSIAIRAEESEVDVRDISITGNGRGIVSVNSSISLQGSLVEKNDSEGLAAEGSRLTLTRNRIYGNRGSGIIVSASEGAITDTSVCDNGGDGIQVKESRMKISGNSIERNGMNGLLVNSGRSIAWGNSITGNGGYDCLNSSADDIRMIGNWWGSSNTSAVDNRIYDRRLDPSRGMVIYVPLLSEKPHR